MNESMKRRIAFALKCKPEEVPEEPEKLREALDKCRADLKVKKKVKHGESIH
ncbi:MAG: hypothetical protein KKD77_21810 [Gammaproteobacteria bacterium]|nr:hypothetical protein [Gammaproteobacteria bacterium]MBU2685602.1 hypothetical protein [Gammaproteobacteria bacterium]